MQTHNRFQGFQVPSLQGPDVEEGGGGGGGTPPPAPSDITTVGTAYKMLGWGGWGHVHKTTALYTTWQNTLGFAGWGGSLGGQKFLRNAGGAHDSTGGTAVGAVGSQYDFQKGYQGLSSPPVNGGNTSLGMFRARDVLGFETYLGWYMHASTQTNGGVDANGQQTHPPLGDWFNDTNWALYAGDCGRIAGFVGFMNGTGVTIDQEAGSSQNNWDSNPKAGVTVAQQRTKIEARGYQVGQAIFTAFPNCSVIIYSWRPPGSYFSSTFYGTSPTDQDNLTQFNFGLMRAMKDANSTGRLGLFVADFYKPTSQASISLASALKVNAERTMACFAQFLPAATRDYIMPKIQMELVSWAGTDGGQFYANVVGDAGHTPEPMFTSQLALYKNWSMGGRRWEYLWGSSGAPDTYTANGVANGYMQTSSTPNPPGAHRTGMLAAAANTNHPNTTAPSLSASKSGSGATRTISATASHEYGMAWCRAYLYPNGTPVYLSGAWNAGGGTQSTNYNNSFVTYTGTVTATAGQYIIVQAQSIMGHQTSRVVAA